MENISTFDSNESALKKRPLPSFIKKLWFILNDAASQEHIFWVDSGQVICVPNASNFSKVILPKYFKHSNWQSFVRQLNLYGFRKVYRLNLSYDDTAEKRAVWQFKHDCFRKDNTEKLCEIKRRTAKPNQEQQGEGVADATDQQHKSDYTNESIENTLSGFSDRLDLVDKKRRDLWGQTVELSRVQAKQQKVVEALVDFIMQLLDKYVIRP
ncbi:HSF-type DNA-binding-domain-containing protein [Helicostylum pulchrum]|nr:HSF-type DNA-binding-domain-containing protein [Helicostylum pulchrum]